MTANHDDRGAQPPEGDHRVQLAVIDHRLLAVKRVGSATADDAARLLHEAEVLRGVTHPNVVTVVAVDDTPHDVTLYLDAVGRHTLADTPPRAPDDLAAVVRDLLIVLAELHERGVTHGSLGTDHVVVGPSGKLTLISFGRGRHALPGSPEHAAAVRSDLAGLGAMVVELAGHVGAMGHHADRRRVEQITRLATQLRDEPTSTAAQRLRGLVAARGDARRRSRRPGSRAAARVPRRVPPRPGPRVMVDAPAATTPAESGWAWPALVLGLGCAVGLWVAGGSPRNPFHGSSGPVGAAVEGVRIVALGAAVYLIATAALSLVASATGSTRLERLAASAAPTWMRRTAVILTGAGVLGSLGPAPGPGPGPDTSTPTTITDRPSRSGRPPHAVAATTTTGPGPSPTTATAATVPVGTPDASAPSTTTATEVRSVIVEPGDHLWSIASRALEHHLERPPTTPEIGPYWRAVIEMNRDALIDPANPDLLHRGQVIRLPHPTAVIQR